MFDPLQVNKQTPSTNGRRLTTNILPVKRTVKNISQVPFSAEGLLSLAVRKKEKLK
jgi:hypothetical protein